MESQHLERPARDARAVTAEQIRQRLRERGLSVRHIAQEAQMWPHNVYDVLNGRSNLTPRQERRIGEAIVRLGLDRDEPSATPRKPVIVHLPERDSAESDQQQDRSRA